MSSGISEVTQNRLVERCVKIHRGIRFVTRLELREKNFCEFLGGGFRNSHDLSGGAQWRARRAFGHFSARLEFGKID